MQFQDVQIGEAVTLPSSSLAWNPIFKKTGARTATDDHGDSIPIDPEEDVVVLESVKLSHAMWVNRGDTWRLVLRWNTPREAAPRWVSLDPQDPTPADCVTERADRRTQGLLASGLHAEGKLKEAIDVYDELLAEREEASLLNNRGAARAAFGDVTGAIADYTGALALDTRLAQAYSNRGNAFTKQGRYADAIRDYDRALDLAGDVAPIYCNRGLTRKLLGNIVGSLEDFDFALAVDPRFAPGYLARGGVRAISGDLSGAITDLRRFLVLSPGASQRQDVDLAIERLQSALDRAY
jgi:tetratricopeptide (TPR) repeat protein